MTATRIAILDAAERVLVEQGLDGASLEDAWVESTLARLVSFAAPGLAAA